MPSRRSAVSRLWFSPIWIWVLLTAAAPALAEGVRGSLQISFTGTSTLHDFEGTAGSVAVSLSQGTNGAWSADVSLPVAEMTTGIGLRDKSMRTMFDAAHHPQIRGRFRDVDAEKVRSSVVLPFVLQIRTVERPVKATIKNWQQNEREASFDASFDLSLASFQLEAPSSFFMSVGDRVHVTVHVTLERA